jgi:fructosamine-3-kinase
MFTQHIETLPVPASSPEQQEQLTTLAQAAAQAASERLACQRDFARRILDLLPSPPPRGARTALGDKLSQWWMLADFKAFSAEVAKRFEAEIPLRQRNDWELLFNEQRVRVQQLGANIGAVERSIDEVVYALFDLSAADIALIERSVKR